jgi:uncharacterized protein YmfQ (DUF2313 family)
VSCQTSPGLDICPTQADLIPQYLALLPRGRAWGEGGPGREPGGVMYGWIAALAAVFAAAHAAICALRLEFFCSSAVETVDWWNEEYGLPDGCDPFPNACAKIAAQGGVTCDYYESVAAEHGWDIVCGSYAPPEIVGMASCLFASGVGARCPYPASVGSRAGGLEITVLVPEPMPTAPAPTATPIPLPLAGNFYAGNALACIPSISSPPLAKPDITGLQCLMARIAPAHAAIIYNFGVA